MELFYTALRHAAQLERPTPCLHIAYGSAGEIRPLEERFAEVTSSRVLSHVEQRSRAPGLASLLLRMIPQEFRHE